MENVTKKFKAYPVMVYHSHIEVEWELTYVIAVLRAKNDYDAEIKFKKFVKKFEKLPTFLLDQDYPVCSFVTNEGSEEYKSWVTTKITLGKPVEIF